VPIQAPENKETSHMDKNKKEAVQDLKAEQVQEQVQEEIMTVAEPVGPGDPGDPSPPDSLEEPLVISLKAERVQGPEAAAAAAGETTSSFFELAVHPYQRVTIDLAALQVGITIERPSAGPTGGDGLGKAG
jgi:hypothetical protein